MALVGVDVKIPKCADVSGAPGRKRRKLRSAQDISDRVGPEGMLPKELHEGKRPVEEEEEDR